MKILLSKSGVTTVIPVVLTAGFVEVYSKCVEDGCYTYNVVSAGATSDEFWSVCDVNTRRPGQPKQSALTYFMG